MAIKKILVTGSSGTIGTRLCEKLLESGNYEVTGVDIKPNKWKPGINSITKLCDLRDMKAVDRLQKGFDIVVHLAANARVYNIVIDPVQAKDNFDTTFNALEYCRKGGAKRFIFASSREVYGNTPKSRESIIKESDARVESSESPYSASKISGEALAHSYRNCYGVDFIITRFSNVYGMYDDSDRFIPSVTRLCMDDGQITIFGKDKVLDFTYIDDAVWGIMLCIEKFDSVKNLTFNIATGKGTALMKVGEMIKMETGSASKIKIGENRVGEVVRFVADISKARKLLGYSPRYSFEEGLKKTIAWYSKRSE